MFSLIVTGTPSSGPSGAPSRKRVCEACACASAVQLGALYRSGAASPVDALNAVLARIANWEPHLHATYALDADAALAQASASQSRWQRGAPLGQIGRASCRERVLVQG